MSRGIKTLLGHGRQLTDCLRPNTRAPRGRYDWYINQYRDVPPLKVGLVFKYYYVPNPIDSINTVPIPMEFNPAVNCLRVHFCLVEGKFTSIFD